jgi:hexosaminidase
MKVVFRITGVFAVVLTALAATASAAERPVVLIPGPREMSLSDGTFTIRPDTMIVHDDNADLRRIARQLASNLEPATGYEFELTANPPRSDNVIRLAIQEKGLPLGNEGYELTVSPNRVVIKAPGPAGVFYGVQTLRQLLPKEIERKAQVAGVPWTLPCLKIIDQPRFPWRGFLLDEGRHFQGKAFVLRFIDQMALHKMNVLHWHLTEDQGWRIEIRKYPRLTQIGSRRDQTPFCHDRNTGDGKPYGPYYYTQDDVREIVAYAADRHVTIVPEIEMPGHAQAAIAAYPELGNLSERLPVRWKWGVNRNVYNVEEQTFRFLEDVLTEVMDLFPSRFIHIGGDECPKAQWKESESAQKLMEEEGLKDEHELQSYFIRRIERFLNSRGRRLIGWDEILEGGLAPNATVMSWRGVKGGIAAARSGHDVVMSPTSHCYLDYCQSRDTANEPPAIGGFLPLKRVYSYEPIPAELPAGQHKHVLGVQGNLWTEYISKPRHVEYMAWPRGCAIAEIGWSPAGKDYLDFHGRLQVHLERFDVMDVSYRRLDEPRIPAGTWTKEIVTEQWTDHTWDVAGQVDGPGIYEVTFQYTGGGCRLDIQWAELRVGGRTVAADRHWATAGGRHEKNVYTLEVKEFRAGDEVALRASIRSDGGTDSRGEIYVKRIE